MYRISFILSLFLFGYLNVNAQTTTKPDVPMDPTSGKIEYTAVVEVANATKDDMFDRAESWAKSFYKNPTAVIQSKDKLTGKIVAKHGFTIFMTDKKGKKQNAGLVNYTLNIDLKDGKYRYSIAKIWWKNDGKKPIEGWLDENSVNKERNFDYLTQSNDYLNDLIKKLSVALMQAPEAAGDDW